MFRSVRFSGRSRLVAHRNRTANMSFLSPPPLRVLPLRVLRRVAVRDASSDDVLDVAQVRHELRVDLHPQQQRRATRVSRTRPRRGRGIARRLPRPTASPARRCAGECSAPEAHARRDRSSRCGPASTVHRPVLSHRCSRVERAGAYLLPHLVGCAARSQRGKRSYIDTQSIEGQSASVSATAGTGGSFFH